jgi:N-methylhydantoinase A
VIADCQPRCFGRFGRDPSLRSDDNGRFQTQLLVCYKNRFGAARMRRHCKMDYTIGVDIGGTFTDCVVLDEQGFLAVGKALSTPRDFSVGALDAVRDAAQNLGLKSEDELIRCARFFFHACTIGDNTLITRSGAKTGLITTRGFGDAILMMRGMTAEGLTEEEAAHTSALVKPEPIVPGTLIEELT